MNYSIVKYPRTQHLQGSRLQPGDEDLSQIPFKNIFGKNIVIEEKIDGANTAISFGADGNLLLQSRGHYLDGGFGERHYNVMKQWAFTYRDLFYSVLGSRYIMYGEWMYAKHTVFYDALPDYFIEFDIYDRDRDVFLSTKERKKLTDKMGIISSVPVLAEGVFETKEDILKFLSDSNYITKNHIEVLKTLCEKHNLDIERNIRETDPSLTMEGLYIKIEEDGIVKERMKYVRNSFYQCVNESKSHWQSRPIIPNQLAKERR